MWSAGCVPPSPPAIEAKQLVKPTPAALSAAKAADELVDVSAGPSLWAAIEADASPQPLRDQPPEDRPRHRVGQVPAHGDRAREPQLREVERRRVPFAQLEPRLLAELRLPCTGTESQWLQAGAALFLSSDA